MESNPVFREAIRLTRLFLSDMLRRSATAIPHTDDTLDTVKKNLAKKKAILVDVRERGEWNHAHLAQASLVPLTELSARPAEATTDLPKNKSIYVHCASGHRCLIAARYLNDLGFDSRPLRSGFRSLVQAGFKIA